MMVSVPPWVMIRSANDCTPATPLNWILSCWLWLKSSMVLCVPTVIEPLSLNPERVWPPFRAPVHLPLPPHVLIALAAGCRVPRLQGIVAALGRAGHNLRVTEENVAHRASAGVVAADKSIVAALGGAGHRFPVTEDNVPHRARPALLPAGHTTAPPLPTLYT